MWYQSIVLLAFAAAVVYYEQSRPILLVSEIAGIVCLYCHFWCSHITEFWLPQSNVEDSSVIVLLCCFSLFVLAFFLGVNKIPIAGMSIICFATMCMIGCLAACIREYNRTRHSLEPKQPLCSDLYGGELPQGSSIVSEAPSPKEHVSVHIKKRKSMFSQGSTTSAKPPWK